MVKGVKARRLKKALLETADEMRSVGVMNGATHQKITLRHMDDKGADRPRNGLKRCFSKGRVEMRANSRDRTLLKFTQMRWHK